MHLLKLSKFWRVFPFFLFWKTLYCLYVWFSMKYVARNESVWIYMYIAPWTRKHFFQQSGFCFRFFTLHSSRHHSQEVTYAYGVLKSIFFKIRESKGWVNLLMKSCCTLLNNINLSIMVGGKLQNKTSSILDKTVRNHALQFLNAL